MFLVGVILDEQSIIGSCSNDASGVFAQRSFAVGLLQ
jgi:hypothetical protein